MSECLSDGYGSDSSNLDTVIMDIYGYLWIFMDIVVHQLHLLGPQQLTLILRQVFGEAAAASAKAGAHVLLEQLSTGHPQHRLEHERPGTPVGSKRGCCKPMSKSFC